jgi:hypothetical protein
VEPTLPATIPSSQPQAKPTAAPPRDFKNIFIGGLSLLHGVERSTSARPVLSGYLALFLQKFVQLHAYVAGYPVRFMALDLFAEFDGALKRFEKIKAGFTVPDMFLEYEAFILIELSVDIL